VPGVSLAKVTIRVPRELSLDKVSPTMCYYTPIRRRGTCNSRIVRTIGLRSQSSVRGSRPGAATEGCEVSAEEAEIELNDDTELELGAGLQAGITAGGLLLVHL
jgi:hypothetical protein